MNRDKIREALMASLALAKSITKAEPWAEQVLCEEALAELYKAAHVRYVRQGPPIQMQDVLLACGELNERERVAVQWVLDRVNELPQQADKEPDNLYSWVLVNSLRLSGEQWTSLIRDLLDRGASLPRAEQMTTEAGRSSIAPAAGLTMDEVVEIFDGVVCLDSQCELVLRARLTAAMEAKTRKA